ncbi:MAG TPA: hypothetical protein VIW03_13335, partial [Anaeromyxobacter sp.]
MNFLPAWVSPAVIVAALIGAAAAAPLYLFRSLQRRDRRQRRERLGGLHVTLRDFLAGDASPARLRREVRATDPELFWQAVELVPLDRGERRRLGHLLERSRPAALERRALRSDSPGRREVAAWRLGMLDSRSSRRALRRALSEA